MSANNLERVLGPCSCSEKVAWVIRRNLGDIERFQRGEGPEFPLDDWTSEEEEEECSQAPEDSSQSINVVDDEAADGGSRKESSQAAPDVAVDDDSRGRAPRTRSRGHNRGTPPARSRSPRCPSPRRPSPRRPLPRRSRRRPPPGDFEYYQESKHLEYIHRRHLQVGEDAEDALVPDGNTVRLPESFLRAEREGRRFQPHTDWTYVSRNTSDWTTGDDGLIDVDFGGPRMYLVGSRIFIVDRTTAGERHRCIDLLRCEQSVESGCPVYAYKFSGVIFTKGQHNHE